MFVNTLFKFILIIFVLPVFITGCIFESDLDVLNKAHERMMKDKGLNMSYFCFDIDGLQYMDDDTVEFNGEQYTCILLDTAEWVLKKELLSEL